MVYRVNILEGMNICSTIFVVPIKFVSILFKTQMSFRHICTFFVHFSLFILMGIKSIYIGICTTKTLQNEKEPFEQTQYEHNKLISAFLKQFSH